MKNKDSITTSLNDLLKNAENPSYHFKTRSYMHFIRHAEPDSFNGKSLTTAQELTLMLEIVKKINQC